jgi:NAD(P)-dependent dehydrogenase (short-subunit alcohol dehydrogenase family)
VPALPRFLPDLVDVALEVSIAGSFSRLGYLTRRRVEGWTPPPRLDGRTVLVTGASSGIGRAAARALIDLGADVWLVGRDRDRLEAAAEGGGRPIVCDLVQPDQLDELVDMVKGSGSPLDALLHNAGALFNDRREAPDGTELTVATHVLAPFRLTRRLPAVPVMVTMSSGGMYTARFDLDELEMAPDDYKGAVAYARAKRAQVVLAEEWGRRSGGHSYSMHPGWASTPGVSTSLPGFSRLGPALRTPAEGADTAVWLIALALSGPAAPENGFWMDRRRRGEYYRPGTGRSPDQRRADGQALWDWCAARA